MPVALKHVDNHEHGHATSLRRLAACLLRYTIITVTLSFEPAEDQHTRHTAIIAVPQLSACATSLAAIP